MMLFKSTFKYVALSFLVMLLVNNGLQLAYADQRPVSKIQVKGQLRVSSDTILSYVNFKKGGKYTQEQLNASVKRLYDTGFFSDVEITIDKGTLIIKVEESPLVNKVAFEGNLRLKDTDLAKELSMKERSIYSLSKLQNDVKKLIKVYQRSGRYAAKVHPKIIELPQNRINIVYEIDEGEKTKVAQIVFAGNSEFSDRRLKSAMITKEYAWYRFFSSADVYDPDKLEFDKELLRRFYMQNGYLDFNISSVNVELTPDKTSFIITFVIFEGKPYRIGEIDIDSKIADVGPEILKSVIKLKKGAIYNEEEIEETVDNLTNYLGDHGYAFVELVPMNRKNPDKGTTNITFVIEPSSKIYINKINIKNNTRTQDRVIRREFRLAEGDPYSATKLHRSKQRIESLGYFNFTKIDNKRTKDPDKVDIDVEVSEMSTGFVNVGVGYNSASGALGQVSLAEANFLGRGQHVRLDYTRSKSSSNINFGFTEPYFMERDLAAGFDVFKSDVKKSRESSYNSHTLGLTLRLGYQLTEYLSHGLRYFYANEKVGGYSEGTSEFIRLQGNKTGTSGIGHSLIYDKLDNSLDPKSGYKVKFDQDFAGIGGNAKYLKHELAMSYHYPIYKKDVIFNLLARAGNITGISGKKIGMKDNFYMGTDYIRGFDSSGIGPRDKKDEDALGGKSYYALTTEVNFPLGFPEEYKVKGVVFHDLANLFGTDFPEKLKKKMYDKRSIRASYGAGIVWHSPAGVIRLEYGKPYKKEHFDKRRSISINFGTSARL